MSINISDYSFDGPFSSVEALQDRSGIYVILTGSQNVVIDVGESATVKTRVSTHDRQGCWKRHSLGNIRVAVLYTPSQQQTGRKEIEQKIRAQYDPACGKQ